MAESHLNALPKGFEFEGYRIEQELGAGGFGITYQATELLIGRTRHKATVMAIGGMSAYVCVSPAAAMSAIA